jgi:uncharacterized membrane protein
MGRKLFFIALVFLINMNVALGATLHGIIYDTSLNTLEDVVVEVNSVPKQTYVSKDGSYSFTLPAGDYVIKATYHSKADRFVAEEELTIKDDGDYVVDLILFPDISEEAELLNENVDIAGIDFEEKADNLWLYILAIAMIILAVFWIVYSKKKSVAKEEEAVKELTDEAGKIIDFIKRNDGRVTQKEIRKNFAASEAKISLMVSELERRGKIKKIETSKGNIIILKK